MAFVTYIVNQNTQDGQRNERKVWSTLIIDSFNFIDFLCCFSLTNTDTCIEIKSRNVIHFTRIAMATIFCTDISNIPLCQKTNQQWG